MKIYTRTGDEGDTCLLLGGRVRKDHPRIEAYGSIDELNAFLGLARAAGLPPAVERTVARVQNELFSLGAELAADDPATIGLPMIGDRHVQSLEKDIDRLETTLTPLQNFILPGSSPASASLHVCRTVCRRAERRVVTLCDSDPAGALADVVRYLNRLGDWLFVASRATDARLGIPDAIWTRDIATEDDEPEAETDPDGENRPEDGSD